MEDKKLELEIYEILNASRSAIDNITYSSLEKIHTDNKDSDLIILHLNIRGLLSNIIELKQLLVTLQTKMMLPDVVLLCETFLNETTKNSIKITGYNLHSIERVKKRGGGVCILVKDDIPCKIVSEYSLINDTHESIMAVLYNKYYVMELYQVPNTTELKFLEYVESVLKNLRGKNLVIGSDYNLDLLKSHLHANTAHFLNCLLEENLLPSITIPTRVTPQTATLIDNIFFTSTISTQIDVKVIETDISDHYPCLLLLTCNINPCGREGYTYQKLDKAAYSQIKAVLRKMNWVEMYKMDSVDDMSNFLTKTIINTRDTYAPLKKGTNSNNIRLANEPWLYLSILKCHDKSQQLYKTWVKSGRDRTSALYESYKNY